MSYNLITILGPTAAGKTRLAVLLANHFNGEIISADSRQVYRNMNIGTGKDLSDYMVNGNQIGYHLIDIADPQEEFNLFRFKQLFSKKYLEISQSGKIPFLVGGTGMYLSSVIQNYNLKFAERSEERLNKLRNLSTEELIGILKTKKIKLHNTTDLINRDRIIEAIIIAESDTSGIQGEKMNSLNIGVKFPRDVIKTRITERLKKRLNEGMIEEVQQLINSGVSYEKLVFFGLEYKYVAMYLKSELSFNDMFQKLNSSIHNFAKRQMTWYRKMEREGVQIFWIEGNDFNAAKIIIEQHYLNQ